MNKRTYSVIGLMSGTSCDGIDLAHCHFLEEKNEWRYKIVNTETINYSKKLRNKLISCGKTNSLTLKKLDNELGKIFSESLVKFINKNKISVDLISSHGHTVFHDIKLQLNHQIGNPLIIYKNTKVPTVHNFRELDVLHGGQGAPLVPYGEKKLFKGYDYCINIGGITNISSLENKKSYGYDICPANIILNKYARKLGYDFDLDGKLSVRGKFKERLFSELNHLKYYERTHPKSLDILYIEKNYYPLFKNYKPKDVLKTYIEHMAHQINSAINKKKSKVLLTGGGVFNNQILKKINKFNKLDSNFIVPKKKIIIFKEAIIFGFLGLLRSLNKKNVGKEITGSSNSTSSGLIVDNKIL